MTAVPFKACVICSKSVPGPLRTLTFPDPSTITRARLGVSCETVAGLGIVFTESSKEFVVIGGLTDLVVSIIVVSIGSAGIGSGVGSIGNVNPSDKVLDGVNGVGMSSFNRGNAGRPSGMSGSIGVKGSGNGKGNGSSPPQTVSGETSV